MTHPRRPVPPARPPVGAPTMQDSLDRFASEGGLDPAAWDARVAVSEADARKLVHAKRLWYRWLDQARFGLGRALWRAERELRRIAVRLAPEP